MFILHMILMNFKNYNFLYANNKTKKKEEKLMPKVISKVPCCVGKILKHSEWE